MLSNILLYHLHRLSRANKVRAVEYLARELATANEDAPLPEMGSPAWETPSPIETEALMTVFCGAAGDHEVLAAA